MKYIISENRLDSIIQKYISSYIGDELTPIDYSPIYTAFQGKNDINYTYWYDKDDVRRFRTYVDELELNVDNELWISVKNMFSISDDSYLSYMIVTWFNNHQNKIEFDPHTEEVYTDDLID